VAQNLLSETAGANAASGATASLVWGVDSGTVNESGVKQTVTPLMEKFADLPGVACVSSPYGETYGPNCPSQEARAEPLPAAP
jgi:hypothetical protein